MSSSIPQSAVEIGVLGSIYTYRELGIDKLKHEYEITVSSDCIRQKMGSRLQEIAKNAKLPGFRSGKMPYDLVVTNYKSEALEYVVNNVIDYCSSDLIKKVGVKFHVYPKVDIVSLPNLDKKDKENDFIYRLSFESMPEVPAIDLDKINLKRVEAKIEEEDIKEFIDSMKAKFPDFVSVSDVSYRAKNGDKLIIDFKGRIRNKLFRGGSDKNFNVILGSGTLVNGFEDQLIGMRKGETKNFKLKFPEDYQVIPIAGQEADFFVLVSDIKIIQGFGSDDEVAKRMGFKDYSLLKNYAKEIIGNQCKEMGDILIKKELFDYLDANYSFGLPTEVVKQEQQRVEKELNFRDDSCKEAERRVKLAVLFMKFSTEHKISLTQNDILSVVMNQYVDKSMPLDKVVKHFKSDKQFQGLVKGQALEHKVTGYIMEKVNKEEQVVSVKELKELFYNI
ncbi:trigger factor [Wolbachia endosymbiont of Dirofilaria (Dirofilaria) immitis]|uniref:trigger factor n=1 Tax=Wolbachia endosymbiont of Dirofilaria (Dirofilaria) immitis TaxID=1812115 RepID=UPI0015887F4D|nr:trigger factor [Wolbachia endosymbiont of Dirofilaria (Dirofilaria) immitis]QKX02352.1 trigger factor [Wolbachia endosymbiont of Dirofilaria (Dirofilaria) immitis]